ncbi:hypothetical protein AAFF_G00065640 [Aldrovandia affinis]|uniref:Arginine vasotocin n=1 Tax=Aldrovandia affinis TaxID=143900 RepID=A0AAD7WY50_9TELE|nr:hypothetical protein AAFF_G00065640 [Aldrovandia affinis]
MPHSVSPVFILCLLALSSACYVQNCPRGGKRSSLVSGTRQCMACGPGGRGRCFGPSICCGEELGCLLGSREMARCAEESYLPTPCEARGRACGAEGGRCAAPGVCCNTEGCLMDLGCKEDRASTAESSSQTESSPAELLLRLLLMATRWQHRTLNTMPTPVHSKQACQL